MNWLARPWDSQKNETSYPTFLRFLLSTRLPMGKELVVRVFHQFSSGLSSETKIRLGFEGTYRRTRHLRCGDPLVLAAYTLGEAEALCKSRRFRMRNCHPIQSNWDAPDLTCGLLGAIREQLADLDLRLIIDYSLVEWKELGEEGPAEPEWMVLCLLPVLPPELRPIIQIDGGKLMSSDINELYRRVIYRNNTLIDLLTTSRSTPGELVMCQEKLVQEAVDTLLDNGIRGQPMRDGHNKVYKSFSDVIEGKEGRFRQKLCLANGSIIQDVL
ncbi:DNA-directed RNA polymerase subunit beta', partial [Cucurbita argyrosperma subsp. sororia]